MLLVPSYLCTESATGVVSLRGHSNRSPWLKASPAVCIQCTTSDTATLVAVAVALTGKAIPFVRRDCAFHSALNSQ